MTTFTKKFDSYVYEGDTITTEAEGLTITARIVRDDCPDTPDERCDGFFSSMDPKNDGYNPTIKSKEALKEQNDKEQYIIDEWAKGDWFYCGVVLSVSKGGILLDNYSASLWGIECNYPDGDNSYLLEVANELLEEAIERGRVALAETITKLSA